MIETAVDSIYNYQQGRLQVHFLTPFRSTKYTKFEKFNPFKLSFLKSHDIIKFQIPMRDKCGGGRGRAEKGGGHEEGVRKF